MSIRTSPEAIEDAVARRLGELLTDVPLARGSDTPEWLLEALLAAAFAHPVFAGWPSPVTGWLDEAEALATRLGEAEALAWVRLRRAVAAMRRGELDSALAALDVPPETPPDAPSAALDICRAIARIRVLVRLQRLDEAWHALAVLPVTRLDGALRALRQLALGEWQIESGAVDAAREPLREALAGLPEDWIEERIQATQSLAFAQIGCVDAPRALRTLEEARALVRGAAVWPEVAQMDVALGSLLCARGDQAAAQTCLAEAAELAAQHGQADVALLAELGMARTRAAAGQGAEAVAACLRAAQGFAARGELLGFVSVLVLMAGIQAQTEDFAGAYRTLATGLAIARHRGWAAVEAPLRAQVDRLRDEVMGAARFDAMVGRLVAEMKAQGA